MNLKGFSVAHGALPALGWGVVAWVGGLVQGFCQNEVSVVDLLVAYSLTVSANGQGPNGVEPLIREAVREMNDAHARSLSSVRFNLVGIMESTEDQPNDSISANLRLVRDPEDGVLDEVPGWRDEVGADIVSWIFENDGGSSVGRASSLTTFNQDRFSEEAYNVIARIRLAGDWVMAHEVGHNLGAEHDRFNIGGLPGLTDCAVGTFFDLEGESYHTIMAQGRFSERLGYFSNPEVVLNGVPVGGALDGGDCGDNVGAMEMGAQLARKFRERKVFNDRFAEALVLEGYGFYGTADVQGATSEPGEPLHGEEAVGRSVWFEWTSPSDETYQFSVFGSTLPVVVNFYTGESLESLQSAASFRVLDLQTAEPLTLQVSRGVTYWIAVDVLEDRDGFVALRAFRDNDLFAERSHLEGAETWVIGDSAFATTEPGEANHGHREDAFESTNNTLWWSWTAPSSGVATVNTQGSLFQTAVAIYQGEALEALSLVAEQGVDRELGYNQFSFPVTSDERYEIALGGPGGLETPGGYAVLGIRLESSLAPEPVRLRILSGAAPELVVEGGPAASVQLEASSDLLQWIPVAGGVSETLPFTFMVRDTVQAPQRFYRVLTVPR